MKYIHNFFEEDYWQKGELLCGIDEVGRGCLLGPLVVGCVILPPYCDPIPLVDSKTLPAKKRMATACWIKQHCVFSVVSIDPWIIDTIGINKSTELAVQRSFYNASQQTQIPIKLILTDHMHLSVSKIAKVPIISAPYGENWSSSVAAASIVAKVSRDQILSEMASHFPTFLLEKNKGYGTKVHIKGLSQAGLSALHRKTYCKPFWQARQDSNGKKHNLIPQLSLF